MNNEPEVTETTDERRFSQTDLDNIIASRLRIQKDRLLQEAKEDRDKLLADSTREAENIRSSARQAVADARGDVSDIGTFLGDRQRQQERDNAEKAQLANYFGPSSSGALASELFKTNPEQYRALRDRAQRLGLVASIRRPTDRMKGFNRT